MARSRWPKRVLIGDPTDPRGFEILIARYLEWLAVHHYSERTTEGVRRYLYRFAAWCEERDVVKPQDVTREMVERYQRFIFHLRREGGKPLGFTTQSQRLTIVRGFFKWLTRERYLTYNPAADLLIPKRPVRLPTDGFTVEEVEQVLSSIDLGDPLGVRDRALLETLYSTGLRRLEVVHLDLFDLDVGRGWVTVRQGKGGKDRVVPIGARALAWVRKYLEEARPQLSISIDEPAVFLSQYGVRFHPGALTNLVSKRIKESGVRNRPGACHLFRHTMATLMLEGGADVRILQEMLGHASLRTTQIYTHVSIHHLKAVHAATHPADRPDRPAERAADVAEALANDLDADA